MSVRAPWAKQSRKKIIELREKAELHQFTPVEKVAMRLHEEGIESLSRQEKIRFVTKNRVALKRGLEFTEGTPAQRRKIFSATPKEVAEQSPYQLNFCVHATMRGVLTNLTKTLERKTAKMFRDYLTNRQIPIEKEVFTEAQAEFIKTKGGFTVIQRGDFAEFEQSYLRHRRFFRGTGIRFEAQVNDLIRITFRGMILTNPQKKRSQKMGG